MKAKYAALAIAAGLLMSACATVPGSTSPTPVETAGSTPAQPEWPTKPLTFLINFAPGGGQDRVARLMQPFLESELGVTVNLEYMEGAGGAIGWQAVADAAPDGYTLTVTSLPHNIVQPMMEGALYKVDGLITVAIVQGSATALVVPLDSPYQSLDDLVAAAKADPGRVTIGGTGSLTSSNLATIRLEELTGTDFEYVSFEGGSAQITAFLGGQVDAILTDSADFAGYKDEGRIIAISSEETFPFYPDAKTFSEQGVDLVQYTQRGLGVAAGTPDYIVAKLESAMMKFAADPGVRDEIESKGGVVFDLGTDAAAEHIASERAIFEPIIERELSK